MMIICKTFVNNRLCFKVNLQESPQKSQEALVLQEGREDPVDPVVQEDLADPEDLEDLEDLKHQKHQNQE